MNKIEIDESEAVSFAARAATDIIENYILMARREGATPDKVERMRTRLKLATAEKLLPSEGERKRVQQ